MLFVVAPTELNPLCIVSGINVKGLSYICVCVYVFAVNMKRRRKP